MFYFNGMISGTLVKTSSPLRSIAARYAWTIPVVAGLGFIASALEGLGISMLIPTLSLLSLSSAPNTSGSGGLMGLLTSIPDQFPPEFRLLAMLTIVLGCIVVKGVVQTVNATFVAFINGNASHEIRIALSKQLLHVGYPFFLRSDPARLLNIISTESWRASDAIQIIFGLIADCGTILVFSILLALIDWKLFLVGASSVLLVRLLQQLITERISKISQKVRDANHKLADRMIAVCLDIAKLARLFGKEGEEQRQFEQASANVRRTMLAASRITVAVGPLIEVIYTIIFMGILLLAVVLGVEIAVLVTFLVLMYRLQPYVRNFGRARVQLLALQASVREVEWLIDPVGKPLPPSGNLPYPGLSQGISFRNVVFHYGLDDNAVAALSKVNFTVQARSATALVGPSGSGKSTIVNLLCRLIEPSSGQIAVDGVDLSQIDPVEWRRHIAVAGQDVELVDGTIADSIAYGVPGLSRDKMIEAARMADAHQFITQLPNGYHTQLGSRGINLSGGQRQRIGIARALARDPHLLILDEATNAIDVMSENEIMGLIRNRPPTMTIIVISHRTSTLDACDQRIVVEFGKVVSAGSRSSHSDPRPNAHEVMR